MSAAVAASEAPAATPLHRLIPLANIQPSKTNQRKTFDKAKLEELASSVRIHGVMQPLLVRPLPGAPVSQDKHEIVAGERRFRAATIAALPEVPCIVRQLNDEQMLEFQVIENVQREDLHPLEEAHGYRDLVKVFKHTPEDLAGKIGKSPSYIAQRMSLVRLAEPVQKLFLEDKINLTIALMIARVPVVSLHAKIAKDLGSYRGGEYTATDARDLIMRNYMLDLSRASFDTKDAKLVPTAGACPECPKRTGNQAVLFADIAKGDLCTDSICFRGKGEEHCRRLLDAAKKNGQRIIEGKEAKEAKPYEHGGLRADLHELDNAIYEDPKHRTARAILGKDFKPALFVDPFNKSNVIEVALRSAIAKALKDQGVKTAGTATRSTTSPADKQRSLNAKIESAARRRIFDALRANITDQLHLDDWRMIALQVWEDHGYADVKVIAEAWAPVVTDEKRTDRDRHVAVAKRIPTLTAPELGRFLIDAILVRDIDVGNYGRIDSEGLLFEMAKRYDVDVAKIRAAAKAELAPAAKKKKTAAKKKTRAK